VAQDTGADTEYLQAYYPVVVTASVEDNAGGMATPRGPAVQVEVVYAGLYEDNG
jgi:hypothetical protein